MGVEIDKVFASLTKLIAKAQFSLGADRAGYLTEAITENDLLKFLLYVLLELDGLEEEIFLKLSGRLEEVGRMLYGWKHKNE